MKNQDALNYAVKEMKHQRLRTWLTIIGIVIGSFALFAVLTVSTSVKTTITDQLSQFGGNNIMIIPIVLTKKLASRDINPYDPGITGKLYTRDITMLKSIPGIKYISGYIMEKATLTFQGSTRIDLVSGSDSHIFDAFSSYLEIGKGRFFTQNEHNVAVLGYTAANGMFKNNISIGNKISINGKSFRVVGILKEIGTSFSGNDDSAIYIPISDARNVFSDAVTDNELFGIMITVADNYDVEGIKNHIEKILDLSHETNEKTRDFTVMTQQAIMDTINEVLDTVDFYLIIIAVITASISAFGIANTMYTSVVERKKEIGTLKAIGASSWEIQKIFLIESMLLSAIGGVLGIFITILVIVGIYLMLNIAIIPSVLDVLIVLVFSLIVGLISGYFPSKQAANIDPIKAINN